MKMQPRARLYNKVPCAVGQAAKQKRKQNDPPPAMVDGRHAFQARAVNIFGKLGQIRLGFIQAADLGYAAEPVLRIQAEVLAVTADNSFADDAAG